MALGGVNLALSLTGQEAVIRETLLQIGMAERNVESVYAGGGLLCLVFLWEISRPSDSGRPGSGTVTG